MRKRKSPELVVTVKLNPRARTKQERQIQTVMNQILNSPGNREKMEQAIEKVGAAYIDAVIYGYNPRPLA